MSVEDRMIIVGLLEPIKSLLNEDATRASKDRKGAARKIEAINNLFLEFIKPNKL